MSWIRIKGTRRINEKQLRKVSLTIIGIWNIFEEHDGMFMHTFNHPTEQLSQY